MSLPDWDSLTDQQLEEARAGVAEVINRRYQQKQLESVVAPMVRAELDRLTEEKQEGMTRA